MELAGLREKAAYRRLAAEVAQRAYAHEEAIHHLTRALHLLDALPKDGSRDEHEVWLQSALGCSLAETRGWAAPEVGPAYHRALALLERTPEPTQLREVLWGLQAFHCVRAELRKQREIGELLLHHGGTLDDQGMAITGQFVLGISRGFLGELVEARDHLEQVIVGFDPRRHSPVSGLGSLTGVFSLGCVSHDLWLLGDQEQALIRSRQALDWRTSSPTPSAGPSRSTSPRYCISSGASGERPGSGRRKPSRCVRPMESPTTGRGR